jgi:hypothetical protein
MPLYDWLKRLCEGKSSATSVTMEDEQRRGMLMSKGARLHAGFAERSDHCSLAVLDLHGIVVCWYDGSVDDVCADTEVLHRHVSQFYVPSDVAAGIPGRSLRCAADYGVNTQHGWRRRPGGATYWGTTVVETIEASDGRSLGFAHITRRSQGPWEFIRPAVAAPRRRRRVRMLTSWSVSRAGTPGLVAV